MRIYLNGVIYEVWTAVGLLNLMLYLERGVSSHLATLKVGRY